MPVYTYRCKSCEHEFQVRQRMVDDALTDCPVCDGKVRRVLSSVGVVFKGKGFYVTDNRTNKLNGKGKSKDNSEKKSEKSSEKAAKPATESKSKKSDSGS